MAKLLTVRKKAWLDRFKPEILRGGVLVPNAGTQSRYYAQLEALIDRMAEETEHEIIKLFVSETGNAYFAADASITRQARILTNALARKFNDLFGDRSQPLAEAMARSSDKASSASLHGSLKDLSGGLSLGTRTLEGGLKDIISASIVENVSLIKSISSQYFTQIQGAVMRSITTGNGLQDLVPFIKHYKNITLGRARMIARDQTKKVFSNINMERMKEVGIKEYEWLHTKGSNQPRKMHIAMSGNIYKIDQPPIAQLNPEVRAHPGQLINCGCHARPVITFGA